MMKTTSTADHGPGPSIPGVLRNLLSAALAAFLLRGSLPGAPAAPAPDDGGGWIRRTPPPVTPDEARDLLAERTKQLDAGEPVALRRIYSATYATPEIIALARALRNDPRRIFDYVHNRVDYVPTYGSVLGATATYYAGRGNDCDQASLLIALMRQAGYTARYVVGDAVYTPARLAAWLGAAESVAQNVLLNGGVPLAWAGTGWQVSRVWAEVYLDGAWKTFDPAMKEYVETPGIADLRSALGYAPAAFLGNAQAGATVTPDSVRNLNEANIRDGLAACSTSLVAHLLAHLPAAGFDEVTGGRAVVETEMGDYPTALPFAVSVSGTTAYDTLPAGLQHTLTVTHQETPANTRTYYGYEVAGQRMTLVFQGSDTALCLEGDPEFLFTNTPSNAWFNLLLTVDHPTAGDQSRVFPLRAGFTYAIIQDFDNVGPDLLAARHARLERARHEGLDAASEPVRGEALWILGQEWCHQVALFDRIVDRLNQTRNITHHRIGLTGQVDGYYIDMPMLYGSTASTDGSSDPWTTARVQSMLASAFEHGIMRQLQDPAACDSVSTVRMLHHSNGAGTTTYAANGGNWTTGTGIRSLLTGYSPETLAMLDGLIAGGYDVILPGDGNQSIEAWAGAGFIQHYQAGGAFSMGMIISGGYAGGYTAQKVVLDPAKSQWSDWPQSPWNPWPQTGADPVDMHSGALLLDFNDLAVGPGSDPLGLRFARRYSSAGNRTDGPLGNGWTHNGQQTASIHSGGPAGLGLGGAVNAASAVAFAHVALDLLGNNRTALGWSTTAIAAKWAMDQLIGNAATVAANGRSSTFLKRADGTYQAPVGSGDRLTPMGGGFTWRDRAGNRRVFDAAGRLTSRSDANGNTATCTYDGNGRLTGVTDAFGKTLAYTYNGAGRLASVSHGGRGVSFIYTGGDLTGFRDAAGNDWAYVYDGEHRLTQVRKASPAGVATVTSTYDALGRVETQTDAAGNTYQLYLSGSRNTEVSPNGAGTTYHYRPDRLLAAIEDPAGNRIQYSYNGLGQCVRVRNRRGLETRFDFHPMLGWPLSRTDADGGTTRLQYLSRAGDPECYDLARIDYPDGRHETFERDARGNLTRHTDAAGAASTFTCNARGQVLSATGPGGGAVTHTYNADGTLAMLHDGDTGQKIVIHDDLLRPSRLQHADGSAESWSYDALDRLVTSVNRAGGVSTSQYDANGALVSLTDPAGYTVTLQPDLMDRITNQTDSVGVRLSAAFDAMSRPGQSADAAGTTFYTRDPRAWLSGMTRAGRAWTWQYDAEGNPTNVVTPETPGVAVTYDAMGRPVGVRNALGHTTSFAYDAGGRLVRAQDPLGAATRYGYDAAGRASTLTNALGAVAARSYDAAGNLVRQTDFDGHATTRGYTPMGRLAAVTNALNGVIRLAYDVSGRPLRETYPDGTGVARAYDGGGRVASVTDEATNTWRFGYTARGDCVAVTNPAGGRISRAFNPDGTLKTTTDSDTGVVSNRYDAARRLVETLLPGGARLRYEYTAHHELAAFTDARGNRTEWSYDEHGRLQRITDARGAQTQFGYDAAGRLVSRTDRAGGQTQYTYDNAGRLASVTDPTGVGTACTRDALGRATQVAVGAAVWRLGYNRSGTVTNLTTPSGRVLARVPDALQRITRQINALNESTLVQYDARGRVAETSDGEGRTTRYAYDPRGLLAGVTLPGGGSAAYAWDALGCLSRLTDLNASSWTFAYTPMGRLQTLTDPLGRATQYGYDARGDLATVAWPGAGGTLACTRDANGAVVRANFSGGPDLAFQYDANGQLTNAAGLSLAYDAEGRVIRAAREAVYGATYDAAGRLATVACHDGALTVTYTYATGAGNDGRLARVRDSLTGTQVDFTYDADRRLRTIAFPNGETITYTWDAADRLVRIQSGGHVDITLAHDRSGRIASTAMTAPLTPPAHVPAASAALQYDAASQISSAGFAHDARGRVTGIPATFHPELLQLTWDGSSRLAAVNGVALAYDAFGDLVRRTEGGTAIRYDRHPALARHPIVVEKNETSGTLLRYYVWTPGGRLLYLIDAAAGNQVRFFHYDRTGSTLALTDATAAVTDAYAYDPFGRLLARTGATPQPFTFGGAWGVRQEGASGLLYQMRSRYYQAALARFLSPEPLWPLLADPKALNPYQYAGADPVRFGDPEGLLPEDTIASLEQELATIDATLQNLWANMERWNAASVGQDPSLGSPAGALGTLENKRLDVLWRLNRLRSQQQGWNPPPASVTTGYRTFPTGTPLHVGQVQARHDDPNVSIDPKTGRRFRGAMFEGDPDAGWLDEKPTPASQPWAGHPAPTYYWRVDEVGPGSESNFRPVPGLWSVRGVTRAGLGATPSSVPASVFRPARGLWAVRGLTKVYFNPVPVSSGVTDGGTQWPAPPDVFRPVPVSPGTTDDGTQWPEPPDLFRPVPVSPGTTDGGTQWPAPPDVFRPAKGLWSVRGYTRGNIGSP